MFCGARKRSGSEALVAKPLGEPAAVLSSRNFPATIISPAELCRISEYKTGQPYFGRSGKNRFDAPGCKSPGTPEFGVCYLGMTLEVAMAESVLHDEEPVHGQFLIARDQVDNNFALYFKGDDLRLLELTGPTLRQVGGNADLAGTTDYELTARWALAVFNNPAQYDGFVYMSRLLNTGRAVALFDRAGGKIKLDRYAALSTAAGFASAVHTLGIELL